MAIPGQDVSMGGAGGMATPALFSSAGGGSGMQDPKQALALAQIIQLLRGQQGAPGGGGAGMGNLMQLLASKQNPQSNPTVAKTSVPMGGAGGIQS